MQDRTWEELDKILGDNLPKEEELLKNPSEYDSKGNLKPPVSNVIDISMDVPKKVTGLNLILIISIVIIGLLSFAAIGEWVELIMNPPVAEDPIPDLLNQEGFLPVAPEPIEL